MVRVTKRMLCACLTFVSGVLLVVLLRQPPASVGPIFSGKSRLADLVGPEDERWMYEYLDMVQHAGLVESHTDQWREQVRKVNLLAAATNVKTICETGFLGGHSSLRWLLHSTANVYSFDTGVHEFTRPAAKWIGEQFPGRFNIIFGDTAHTLPMFRQEHPHAKCDLMLVDGGRSRTMVERDLHNFHALATLDLNVVIVNDVYCESQRCHGPTEAWTEFLRSGSIKENFKQVLAGSAHGFAYGSFQSSTSRDVTLPPPQSSTSRDDTQPPPPCEPQPPPPCEPQAPIDQRNPAVSSLHDRLKQMRNKAKQLGHTPPGRADVGAVAVLGCFLINRPDLAIDMLESIDHPVDTLVVVHMADSNAETNTDIDSLFQWLDVGKFSWRHPYVRRLVTVHNSGVNLGFGGGVNQVILAAPSAPYWLIASNDVKFRAGSLAEIAEGMSKQGANHNSCVWGLCGDPVSQYASFVLTQRAIKTVGYFDENFWPAYAEDCDYTARLLRGNCPVVFEKNPTRLADHVGSAAWMTTAESSTLASIVQNPGPTFNNFDYLESKWGQNVCNSRFDQPPYIQMVGFQTPFNNPSLTVRSWTLDKERRRNKGGPDGCVLCTGDAI